MGVESPEIYMVVRAVGKRTWAFGGEHSDLTSTAQVQAKDPVEAGGSLMKA